ncbi:MAG: hypothetical protein ABI467_24680, partial [Kofleriaceae bacterium]
MLRGVMADAECPRCGTTALPPEAGLVTCTRCGLVYPPHEVQHKFRHAMPPDYPAPPPNVDAFIEADVVIVRWPLARYAGVLMISCALALAAPIHELARWYTRTPLIALGIVVVYYGLVQLLGNHQVAISTEQLTHHVPFALIPSRRFDPATLRGVAVVPTWFGGELHARTTSRRARTLIASGVDRTALHYA